MTAPPTSIGDKDERPLVTPADPARPPHAALGGDRAGPRQASGAGERGGVLRVTVDAQAEVLERGRTLLGGHPWRLVRLSADGAAALARWRAGQPVAHAPAERRLAAHLIAAGLLHPAPLADATRAAELTVVIPVRDRPDVLAQVLGTLTDGPDPAPGAILVVDDGSLPIAAARTAAIAEAAGARLVRRERAKGAAAARNLGATQVTTPLVCFLDSDCRPEPGWLAPLLGHLDDPDVGAVAPRIRAAAGRSAVSRYEAARSPLDLGPHPDVVRPLGRVPYVPSAALVVRRAAFEAVGGFDEALPIGEDVDLVWRLRAAGWQVRHEPASEVVHDHRRALRGLLARRVVYGTSVPMLWRRHPGAIPPVVLSPTQASAWAALLAGAPATAAFAAGAVTGRSVHQLRSARLNPRDAARLLLRARSGEATAVLNAATCWWWPALAAAALVSRPARRLLAAATVLPALAEWHTRRPALDPLRWLAIRTLDDAANALGVWQGCARERTALPLLPTIRRLGVPR